LNVASVNVCSVVSYHYSGTVSWKIAQADIKLTYVLDKVDDFDCFVVLLTCVVY